MLMQCHKAFTEASSNLRFRWPQYGYGGLKILELFVWSNKLYSSLSDKFKRYSRAPQQGGWKYSLQNIKSCYPTRKTYFIFLRKLNKLTGRPCIPWGPGAPLIPIGPAGPWNFKCSVGSELCQAIPNLSKHVVKRSSGKNLYKNGF